MVTRKLYKEMHTLTPSGTRLTLYYYLLKTASEPGSIYGIEVYSSPNSNPSDAHSEEVQRISHSLTYVLSLLHACSTLYVTPTDLFSSLDTLIDKLG